MSRLQTTLLPTLLCLLTIGHVAADEPTSQKLTGKAWDALGKKRYDHAIKLTRQCIDLYGKDALKMQASLKEAVNSKERSKVGKYWALNDVGTCYWILGQALEKSGQQKEALRAYEHIVTKVAFAQTWDPKGWYWKPADAARGRLSIINGILACQDDLKINWKLVWSDEFNKPGLPDQKKWTYEVGYIRNNEAQYYTKDRRENGRIDGGHLIIEARKDSLSLTDKSRLRKGRTTANITAASLTTKGKKTLTYGKVEVRAKLPAGRGVWPAIWMLGTNIKQVGWPACGEIDIMEFVGHNPGVIHANLHTRGFNHIKGNGRGHYIKIPDASTKFHVYSMEWTKERIRCFVDGKCYFACVNDGQGVDSWPFDKSQYLILNLAIGGSWGGEKGIDEKIFPQQFLIDYVRIYEQDE